VLVRGGAPLEQAASVGQASREALARAGVRVADASADPAIIAGADVVLTRDDPDALPFLVRHARRALAAIHQNVAIAVLTKVAFLLSALFGAAPLWLAVLADTGATVAVTLNGLRLLRAR
jgi:Cd2+/Zn2+-exporting ATPase